MGIISHLLINQSFFPILTVPIYFVGDIIFFFFFPFFLLISSDIFNVFDLFFTKIFFKWFVSGISFHDINKICWWYLSSRHGRLRQEEKKLDKTQPYTWLLIVNCYFYLSVCQSSEMCGILMLVYFRKFHCFTSLLCCRIIYFIFWLPGIFHLFPFIAGVRWGGFSLTIKKGQV